MIQILCTKLKENRSKRTWNTRNWKAGIATLCIQDCCNSADAEYCLCLHRENKKSKNKYVLITI